MSEKSKAKAKAVRELTKRLRAKTFTALKQILCPDANWVDLFNILGQTVELDNKQMGTVRSGQRHFPDSEVKKLQDRVDALRRENSGDDLMIALLDDVDVALLGSPAGEVREQLNREADVLAAQYLSGETIIEDDQVPTENVASGLVQPSIVTNVERGGHPDGVVTLLPCILGTSGKVVFDQDGNPTDVHISIVEPPEQRPLRIPVQ